MPPKKRIARKDKPKREKWVVVNAQGALKYPAKLGETPEGFSKDKAHRLALPAHESHAYTAVPIGYFLGEHTSLEGLGELPA